ncbi:hypothetical protein IV454_21090 [Massilia antarctica]|uniref:Uncharacterized protein n=1 Tax=Massilia antarctica TaxID=2765360 RepID=A0AA48W8P9_9BURK|nr:hypothetical protein [Massilia antarctica]QPI48038.1 hypothetical protein IV454_21090 [Massilia antarctica]
MAFVMDRKTLLAINRRASEMLREMDGRGAPVASRPTPPSPLSCSGLVPIDADLWPSATTQFSLEEIREAFRIANQRLNSEESMKMLKFPPMPDEKDD